jgi:hypothetical protein
VAEANDNSNAKRCKQSEADGNESGPVKAEETRGSAGEEQDAKTNNTKPPEAPKDYIHVRARRGQATDSHSLAERVRYLWLNSLQIVTLRLAKLFSIDIV